MKKTFVLIGSCAIAGSLSGCGTISSMSHFSRGTPIVYSGTRLDVAAINDDADALHQFESEPPKYPKADLPASVVLDTVLLPGTLVVAVFRQMFW